MATTQADGVSAEDARTRDSADPPEQAQENTGLDPSRRNTATSDSGDAATSDGDSEDAATSDGDAVTSN